MLTVWDIIFLRAPVLNYVSPPICEIEFSGSSNPVIILSYPQLGRVTGLVLGGAGGFRLSWNAFPGALCYNVYYLGAGQTVAVLLAECITDPFFELPPGLGPGEVVVTAITLDGETEPSDPIPYPDGGTISNVNVETMCPQASRVGFPGVFRIYRNVGVTSGNLIVNFTMSGTAVNGVDYGPIPLQAVIPNGSDFVLVDIEVIEAALAADKTATLTITPSFSYVVDSPGTADVELRPPLFRIVGYGDSEPLFTPPVLADDSDFCEWDGTFNVEVDAGGGAFNYIFTDAAGHPVPVPGIPEASIQGKRLLQATIQYDGFGQYDLKIECEFAGPGSPDVWEGRKIGGATAAGIYDVMFGPDSDLRLTVEVEAFP